MLRFGHDSSGFRRAGEVRGRPAPEGGRFLAVALVVDPVLRGRQRRLECVPLRLRAHLLTPHTQLCCSPPAQGLAMDSQRWQVCPQQHMASFRLLNQAYGIILQHKTV